MFKKYNGQQVDVFDYCQQQKTLNNDVQVFIGTDSILHGGNIHYFLVVAFRTGPTGVHFIYQKEKIPVIKTKTGKPNIIDRLRKEGIMSIELAESLVNAGIFQKNQIVIELDFNKVVETVSTKLIPEMQGWAIGIGYQVLTKFCPTQPAFKSDTVVVGNDFWNEQVAVKAANHLCQGISN